MKKKWLHIFLAVLLLCLLMAASPAMASETADETVAYCNNCKEFTDFIIIGYIPTPISSTPDPVAHWAEAKCKTCGNIQQFVLDDDRRFHTGGAETPTCTTGKICEKCRGEYGILGHDWGETWYPSGDNKTHYHTCQRDGCDAIEIAPATALPPASRWEPALPAAGNTMEIITLTVTGQAMTRSTGIPVSMGTVQKERARLNITSFLALWTHALSPRPPASPRPCTMKTARAASSRERSLIHTRITAQTRPTTTSSATQPKPPPAPIPAGLPMMPASARAAAIPPMRKFPLPAIA